jgi:uncharacterized protein
MHWSKLKPLGLGISADLSTARCLDPIVASGRVTYFNLGSHATQLARLDYYLPRLAIGALPKVFHTLNLNLADCRREHRNILRRTREIIKRVQPQWMASDIAIWLNPAGVYLDALMLAPLLDRSSAREVTEKVLFLQDFFAMPFMVENPPFQTPPPSELHLLDFLVEVANAAGCGIVLDIGHLLTYLQANGETLDAARLERFPFEIVGEVHLAGLTEVRVRGGRTILLDRHDAPIRDDCWQFLAAKLPAMRNLKGLTLEQEQCPEALMRSHIERAGELLRWSTSSAS